MVFPERLLLSALLHCNWQMSGQLDAQNPHSGSLIAPRPAVPCNNDEPGMDARDEIAPSTPMKPTGNA